MIVLGLSCGGVESNSEILLREALAGAAENGHETRLLRLSDLELPIEITIPGAAAPAAAAKRNDAPFMVEQLLSCDAFLISAPTYTRTIPGKLKILSDRVMGPSMDYAFKMMQKAANANGDPRFRDAVIDERIFRPRVGGLIACGGAESPEWLTLTLPLMHMLMFPSHIRVVDQMLATALAHRGEVVLRTDYLARARQLGRNVASQLGKPHDEAEYLGAPGSCPVCQQDLMVWKHDHVECAICAIRGEIAVVAGKAAIRFTASEIDKSILNLKGKQIHAEEIRAHTAQFLPRAEEAERLRARYRDLPVIHPFD